MIPLELVKQHLRVDDDQDQEDFLIQAYIDAAGQAAQDYLCRRVYATAQDIPDGDPGLALNSAITAAVLLMVGDMYAHRERFQQGLTVAVPDAAYRLLRPHRLVQGP